MGHPAHRKTTRTTMSTQALKTGHTGPTITRHTGHNTRHQAFLTPVIKGKVHWTLKRVATGARMMREGAGQNNGEVLTNWHTNKVCHGYTEGWDLSHCNHTLRYH